MYLCTVKRKLTVNINLKTMRTKIFIIEDAGDLIDALTSMIDRAEKPCNCRNKPCSHFIDDWDDEDDEDEWAEPLFHKKKDDVCRCNFPPREEAPLPEWGIAGTPADPNMRFGAAFEIDEPRAQDYEHRWQFESDHAAYDRFVEAGEDCVARNMEKKGDAPIHKCQAVRRRLEDGPVINLSLIGETDWWS